MCLYWAYPAHRRHARPPNETRTLSQKWASQSTLKKITPRSSTPGRPTFDARIYFDSILTRESGRYAGLNPSKFRASGGGCSSDSGLQTSWSLHVDSVCLLRVAHEKNIYMYTLVLMRKVSPRVSTGRNPQYKFTNLGNSKPFQPDTTRSSRLYRVLIE